jgi:hypothetical protein
MLQVNFSKHEESARSCNSDVDESLKQVPRLRIRGCELAPRSPQLHLAQLQQSESRFVPITIRTGARFNTKCYENPCQYLWKIINASKRC